METELNGYPYDISWSYDIEDDVIFVDMGDTTLSLTSSDIDAMRKLLDGVRDE